MPHLAKFPPCTTLVIHGLMFSIENVLVGDFDNINFELGSKVLLFRSPSGGIQERIVLESVLDATWSEILAGKFAFISPVITSTEGRCVATKRCSPAARAI